MAKILKNIFLYFSAFIPMYVLIIIKFILGTASNRIPFTALTYFTIILFSVLILCGVLGLIWNIFWTKEKAIKIKITSCSNLTDQHFMGYFSLFVLFALTFELTKISMFMVSLISIIFIGIVYINNQMFYINPCLNILGFNFYQITYVTENNQTPRQAKLFYKGQLQENKQCLVKLKNTNFAFVQPPNKNKKSK